MEPMHGTTILCVSRDGRTAMAADGQVTLGGAVVKHGAKKIRRLYKERILAGFAGGVADAVVARAVRRAGDRDPALSAGRGDGLPAGNGRPASSH